MEVKVYTSPLTGIDPDALLVLSRLKEAGYVAYLVGGSVRDLLLGHKPKDYDISTSARPEEVRSLFRNCLLIGRRFRLAHIRFGKKVIEVATFRAGDPEDDELITRDNTWGSPEEDVLRRDFTINGLFYDPESEKIIDYVDGYTDLEKRHLRTIGIPYMRFKQDPVRMIRLLKFQARFGFEVDAETRLALLDCRGEILKSSQARVFEELLRMLETGSSERFFRLLADHGFLELLLPMLSRFIEKKSGDEIYDYLNEIDTRVQKQDAPMWDRAVLLSALLYPFLQGYLESHFTKRGRVANLGEIYQEAYDLAGAVFSPFFLFPKKIRVAVAATLTSQYRFTPFEKKGGSKPRIPQDPDFPLALQFLELRACIEPGLGKILEEWSHALEGVVLPAHEKRPPRRRRRRR